MSRRPTKTKTGQRTIGDPSMATSMRLLLAAERLIADEGVAHVSMRRINIEAGTGNISAVHYHFRVAGGRGRGDLRAASARAGRPP